MVQILITCHQKSSPLTESIILSAGPEEELWPILKACLAERFPRERLPRTLSLLPESGEEGLQLRLSVNPPLLVNGVEVRHRLLGSRDILHLGSLRLSLELSVPAVSAVSAGGAAEPSAEPSAEPPAPPAALPFQAEPVPEVPAPEPRKVALPEVSPGPLRRRISRRRLVPVLLLLVLLILPGVLIPLFRDRVPSGPEGPDSQSSPVPASGSSAGPAGAEGGRPPEDPAGPLPAVTGASGFPESVAAGPESNPGTALRRWETGEREKAEAAPPVTVPPGGVLPDLPLDVLVIHAHPDDESLDFGVLLAWCRDRGLRTGVVLLTDGESGQDLYPRRKTGGIYPAGILSGQALAEVRIQEAREAMALLGADLYIRLGLPNHPYNGKADEISPERVMEDWGGREEVIGSLEKILVRYRPRLVAAPDGPSAAKEHFEHETAGLLVRLTLDDLARRDREAGSSALPGARLVCIDPRQQSLYPDRVGLSGGAFPGDSRYRDRQMQALAAHRTQTDAAVHGRQFLPGYPEEVYGIRLWNLPGDWEAFKENPGAAGF